MEVALQDHKIHICFALLKRKIIKISLHHVLFPINGYNQQWKNGEENAMQTKLSDYNSYDLHVFHIASVAQHTDATTSQHRGINLP